ncbi:autophagy protein Atg13 [Cordyceps javanica]|uniref:Autophagy-related protein 13 n=1 Tax=Cordyceps javanica TaxID=43265 RepID=A0A545V7L9_9HYPO|nr:autophagy protein Atg13 [Cordyceps javanica]
MHQQARIPQRKVSSPAPSPQLPSSRNLPSSDAGISGARPRAASILSMNQPAPTPAPSENATASALPNDSVKKLDQIVQNFYTKAAALILDSRMKLRPIRNSSGAPKVNKWYQIETDEIDDFREELRTWKTCGSLENLPPPMVIEVYLDTSSLKESQSLVTVDEHGKRWDVIEQLQSSRSSDGTPPSTFGPSTEVVLERWTVELIPNSSLPTDDFVQPGSGLLAEPDNTSSGSLPAEEDDISVFLKILDRMVAPASMSPSSSSPGKPISPHTPHTPAIPSRLSENSIVDHSEERSRAVSRGSRPRGPSIPESDRQNTITQAGTTAIDIPLSPRLGSHQRRSSSVAQQTRATVDDEETDLAFANRSVSLGAEDREPPTLSTLLGRQLQLEEESIARESPPSSLRPAPDIRSASVSVAMLRASTEEAPPDGLISVAQSSSPFQRKRYAGMSAGRGQTPPPQLTQSVRGSYAGGSSSRLVRGDDESVGDEPLMFTLSEMDAQGRRSLEEGRGSVNAGCNTSSDRAGFEHRGTTRRGW